MGMGLFLDVQNLYQNLVNSPMNLSFEKKGLYVDNLGQDITFLLNVLSLEKIGKLDFKQFRLNLEYVKELNEAIIQQTLRKDYSLYRI
ncbi:hypothetical protein EON63_18475 [archaeon]|nr:MAG: hypothetical protein EON63_18475 [archaeon]